MVTYLGINYSGTHDSSIATVSQDGLITYAVSEERFSRVKKDGRFPSLSLQTVDLEDVVGVAIPYLENDTDVADHVMDPFFSAELLPKLPPRSYPSYLPEWYAPFKQLQRPIHFYDHHLCHASLAYYMSGYRNALIITSDYGATHCPWNMAIYMATPERIVPKHMCSNHFFYPLCKIYSDVTSILGFAPCMHEGKVTGLAAYGKDDPDCEREVWELFSGLSTKRRTSLPLCFWTNLLSNMHPASFESNAGLVDQYRRALGRYSDEQIARAVQNIIEKKMLRLVRAAQGELGSDCVILSGGIFANVKLNLEVKRLGFKHIFVCPPMGDEGLSAGAALAHWSVSTGFTLFSGKTKTMLLGSTIEDTPVKVAEMGVRASRLEDEASTVAGLLSCGHTVARVVGPMEFGPRALGNRSILYQATDINVNDWLNTKLHRTEFMPFAPITRKESASEWFDNDDLSGAEYCAEFMTICLRCKPELHRLCPAVVHVDGTARPQLVDQSRNPELHAILSEYESLSGLPMLINTSFNIHDEPIIRTAEEAIIAFFQSGLDYIVLGRLLISRTDNLEVASLIQASMSGLPARLKQAKTEVSRCLGNQLIAFQQELDTHIR